MLILVKIALKLVKIMVAWLALFAYLCNRKRTSTDEIEELKIKCGI